MKKFLAVLAVLWALTATCALAQTDNLYIYDDADLFTTEQEEVLNDKAAGISEAYGMDVILYTNESLFGKEPKLYAADYFNEMNFGQGSNRDGILYMVSMGERDYALVTHGDGIRVFTDYGIEQIMDRAASHLSDGEFFDAYMSVLSDADLFLAQAQKGEPYDVKNRAPFDSPLQRALSMMIFGVPAALLISGIMVFIRIRGMKTRRPQLAAQAYADPGSFVVKKQSDIYLYTTRVERTIKDDNKSSGGSTTFSSSSGDSFGGGSGKF